MLHVAPTSRQLACRLFGSAPMLVAAPAAGRLNMAPRPGCRPLHTTLLRGNLAPIARPHLLPEFSLKDKVIVVSGGARGLGLVQAEALLEAGATGTTEPRVQTPDTQPWASGPSSGSDSPPSSLHRPITLARRRPNLGLF